MKITINQTSSQASELRWSETLPTYLLTDLLTGVKCRATSVAKKYCNMPLAYDAQVQHRVWNFYKFDNTNQLLIVALVYHGAGTIYNFG